jgi:hypothetical protein
VLFTRARLRTTVDAYPTLMVQRDDVLPAADARAFPCRATSQSHKGIVNAH